MYVHIVAANTNIHTVIFICNCKLNVHYFWAQLVYDLKGLHDPDLPPMFGD